MSDVLEGFFEGYDVMLSMYMRFNLARMVVRMRRLEREMGVRGTRLDTCDTWRFRLIIVSPWKGYGVVASLLRLYMRSMEVSWPSREEELTA